MNQTKKEMLISISEGLNQRHRTAINQSIHRLNSEGTADIADKSIIILVGTKNIVFNALMAIFSKHYIILYFTGLGRLYTDFGLLGRMVFYLLIMLASLRKQRKFIVENAQDRRVIYRWTRHDIALINGSGFTKDLYKKKAQKQRQHTIGYMSRFGTSKCTDQIIKMIASMPDSCKMIIAGEDISGTDYSDQFYQLARSHGNVEMLGFLETPEDVGDFFQSIDVLLYPSLREGLPITLLESIYYHVPFLTTNVAGCIDLANRFGFPTSSPKDFGDQTNHLNLEDWGQYAPRWDAILEEFSTPTVEKQLENVFREAILENQAYSTIG
ncbi:glycosyltransferase [Alphaproteobacteria bacterium]|nr:glycosyltransferase [Alphaproteobacteria bacterium]